MAVKSSALITCNRSVSAGRQIHFKSWRENSCKTKDVILRLLSTPPSAGRPHLFTKTETSQYFSENQKGSGEECEDHLFYQMPELPQVTQSEIKFHTLFTGIGKGTVGSHYLSNN